MTREEIIQGLKFTIEMFLFDPSTGETITEPRNDMDKTTIDACRGAIELLEQEPKTGHWVEHKNDKLGVCMKVSWECSNCHTWLGCEYFVRKNFCPNCGARMGVDK